MELELTWKYDQIRKSRNQMAMFDDCLKWMKQIIRDCFGFGFSGLFEFNTNFKGKIRFIFLRFFGACRTSFWIVGIYTCGQRPLTLSQPDVQWERCRQRSLFSKAYKVFIKFGWKAGWAQNPLNLSTNSC